MNHFKINTAKVKVKIMLCVHVFVLAFICSQIERFEHLTGLFLFNTDTLNILHVENQIKDIVKII